MKTNLKLITGSLAVVTVLLVTSCGPSREYSRTPPSRVRASFSLIISPTPGFVMSRHRDGRYYYRSPQGYIYWKGYDDRFYLDRSYLNRVHYNQREYNDWKRYNNNNNNNGRRRRR
jgi:hypothetical protein